MRLFIALVVLTFSRLVAPGTATNALNIEHSNSYVQATFQNHTEHHNFPQWNAIEIEIEEESSSARAKKAAIYNSIIAKALNLDLSSLHLQIAPLALSDRKGVLYSEPIFILQERFLI